MPLNDQNVTLRERKQYKPKLECKHPFFAVGFNGQGLCTNGIPRFPRACWKHENDVKEIGNPSSGNLLNYFQFPEMSLVKTLVMKNTDKHL